MFEPAFNRFDPLPAGELRTDLLALAEESGVPVQDVLVSDASRRTTALNAYVSGLGATRRIVVYDTTLEELPDEQIESIVAHELGHVANRDVLTGTLIGALGAAAATALLGLAAHLDAAAAAGGGGRARRPPRGAAGAVPAGRGEPAGHAGAEHGVPADRGAGGPARARPDPRPGVLRRHAARLATTNLSDPDPPAAWHWFFGSHPTTAQRVAFAEDWARADRP